MYPVKPPGRLFSRKTKIVPPRRNQHKMHVLTLYTKDSLRSGLEQKNTKAIEGRPSRPFTVHFRRIGTRRVFEHGYAEGGLAGEARRVIPNVNIGPNTACGGQGHEWPWASLVKMGTCQIVADRSAIRLLDRGAIHDNCFPHDAKPRRWLRSPVWVVGISMRRR